MNHVKLILCKFPSIVCTFFLQKIVTYSGSIWANLNITHNFPLFYITFLNMSSLEAKTNLKAFQYVLGRLNFSLKVLKDRIDDNKQVQEVTVRRM